MIHDAFAFIGFSAMTFGLAIRFGIDVACIISGATLLALAIIGVMKK
jgi:hypothetical protein